MKLSLSKINFINIFAIVVIFSIILSIFIYQFSESLYEKKVIALEKNYYEKNKTLVKNEVDRSIKRVEVTKKIIFEKNELILKEKVNFIKNLFDSDAKLGDADTILSHYQKELDLLKWDNSSGYIYIFDINGKILYHGDNKKHVNNNIFEFAKNNYDLDTFLKKTLVLDENFGSYKWYKPNENPKELYTKYVYIKKDEKHDVYIAAGVYQKEIDIKVQELAFDELRKDRFGDGNYGYFWIVGLDKVMRMNSMSPDFEGKEFNYVRTMDGKVLIDVIIEKALNNGGYVNYKWIDPHTKRENEKISYVQLIPEWNLIVGTGFYLTELQDLLQEEKVSLKKLSDEYLSKIYVVLSILIGASLIIARYLSLKIERVEIERAEQMHLLEQYKQLLDTNSVVSKANKQGLITYVNESFEKVSGYTQNESLGRAHSLVHHPDTPKSQFKELWETITRGEIWKGILKNKRKNGESYYASTTIIPIKNPQGEIIEYLSSGTDITEHIENREKLQNLFKTDTLTGLGNRVSLLNYLSKNDKVVLALINIDRFREINDSFSHEVGDEVIRAFANRLFDYFNDKSYILYRIQADIFGIINTQNVKDTVIGDIKKFMSTLGNEPYEVKNNKFILTYTCGLASNRENLFAYADIALSEAKNKKTKIVEYDLSLKNIEYFKNNIQWVERLSNAINEDRIVPHFQPIFNYKTGKVDKYEALMRLIEDDKIIYPNEYLNIAKKTKLYPELTYKMVEKVLSKFTSSDLEFSINLCIEDLMNEELMIFLYDYAEKKDVFERMVLEIVESEEIEDSDNIAKVIQKFKDKGTKIAIDDFGSGYSNYQYLITLQADYIKIDGSITKLVTTDARTVDVVKSILEFARISNMKVIAEFVSDEAIDGVLRELGVDYAQGYYYGKPQADLLHESLVI